MKTMRIEIQMKSMVVVLIALVLAFMCSCKKDNSNTLTGNITVITLIPTDISDEEATCAAKIMVSADMSPEKIGVCWSTTANPTIDDNLLYSNNCGATFVCTLEGLAPETKYHVRAFASKGEECVYGNDKEFFTLAEGVSPGEAPTGANKGLFSVGNGKRVWFSQGNLQYQASTNTWRFAENQWDFVGGTDYETGEQYGNVYEDGVRCDNKLISNVYDGWIDLFGWGTSGYNHGAICFQPWSTSRENANYYAYGSITCGLDDNTGQADWGYNAILNGGNQEHMGWRTLTKDEYVYLLVMRNTISGIRYAKATVNEVQGLVLLPDNWSNQKYSLTNTNDDKASFDSNVISLADWMSRLESNGAVFLPITGYRWHDDGEVKIGDIIVGFYWSASTSEHSSNYNLVFTNKQLFPYNDFEYDLSSRSSGLAVRLVQDR